MKKSIDEGVDKLTPAAEITVNKSKMFPTYLDLLAFFGLFVLAQALGAVLGMALLQSSPSEALQGEKMGYLMLISQAVSFISAIVFMKVMRRKRGDRTARVKFSSKGFSPVVILMGVVMVVSISVIIEPLLAFLPSNVPNLKGGGLPVMLAAVVVAPIFEEYLCRGLLLESIRAKSGVVMALVLSSLIFGLMHLDGVLSVNAFFVGLVLGYIYILTKSLFAPIIIHMINNALAYAMMLFDKQDVTVRSLVSNDTLYYIIYGIALAIFVVAKIYCTRRFKQIIAAEQEAKKAKESAFSTMRTEPLKASKDDAEPTEK